MKHMPLIRRSALALAAIAAIASLLPSRTPDVQASEPVAKPMPSRGGGYTLSEHVKQYYKTTRI